MANFSALKTAIQNAIKQNGNEEITGDVLQQILLSIVSTMGDGAINTIEQNLSNETTTRQSADTQLQNAINAIKANIDNGYVYAGIATPSTTPVSGKVFYIATAAGTYTNFGGQVLTQGINILRFNGSAWSSQQLIGIDDVPTAGSNKLVKSGGVQNEFALGAVYDVSAKNPTGGPNNDGKWESLSALLSDANLNTLIPTAYRKGGMSIKFVQSSDNKYIRYNLLAQSFTTDTTQWAIDDAGVYVESPEFVYVFTDKDKKILLAIQADGGLYFGKGVPTQIVEYITSVLDEYSTEDGVNIKDFLFGFDGITNLRDYLNSAYGEYIENEEWVKVYTDKDGKIIYGINSDGSFYIKELDNPIVPLIDDISDKVNNNVIQNPSIVQSAFIDPQEDTLTLAVGIPQMREDCSYTVNVANFAELSSAIERYNQENESVYIRLTNDIPLLDTIEISNTGNNSVYRELTINGCGHRIYQKTSAVTPSGYYGGMAYSDSNVPIFSSPYDKWIAQDGRVLGLSKSKFYEATSQVSAVENEVSTYKFSLPKELYDLEISGTDNVYINLSSWFVSATGKVLRITEENDEKFLYFLLTDGGDQNVGVNGDYRFAGMYTSFFFINLYPSDDAVYIRDGITIDGNTTNRIYYPGDVSELVVCGDFVRTENSVNVYGHGVAITSNNGVVKIANTVFQGAFLNSSAIYINESQLILDYCKFDGIQSKGVIYCHESDNFGVGGLYIFNSLFENLDRQAVFSLSKNICVVDNTKFVNCGLRRTNGGVLLLYGKYYINKNHFENYGQIALCLGASPSSVGTPELGGIVQNNIFKFTLEYMMYSKHYVTMDAGAIYLETLQTNTVIRYNRIINYSGRNSNRGIFCDDGASNFKIYGNVIDNVPNSNAIDARFVYNRNNLPSGYAINCNRIIANNVLSGKILIESNGNIEHNGCFLGSNIITEYSSNPVIYSNLEGVEPQYNTLNVKLHDGYCVSMVSLKDWNIN